MEERYRAIRGQADRMQGAAVVYISVGGEVPRPRTRLTGKGDKEGRCALGGCLPTAFCRTDAV